MTSRIRLILIVVTLLGGALSARQATFRSSADGVVVDVSVRDGRRPVLGLTADTFQLLDNGIAQHVDTAEVAPTGIDITAVLDISGSASPFALWMLNGLRDVQDALTPDDLPDLVLAGRQIRASRSPREDVLRVSPPIMGDGGSHLFDAIVAASMKAADPGRRHLILAFTDGLDTRSVISSAMRQDILRRSNAIVELFAISTQGRTNNSGVIYLPGDASRDPLAGRNYGTTRPLTGPEPRESIGDFDHVLQAVVDAAAGTFYNSHPTDKLTDRIKSTLDLFRHHYLLRFRPAGVPAEGWHELKVSVRRGNYEVVARRGYDATR